MHVGRGDADSLSTCCSSLPSSHTASLSPCSTVPGSPIGTGTQQCSKQVGVEGVTAVSKRGCWPVPEATPSFPTRTGFSFTKECVQDTGGTGKPYRVLSFFPAALGLRCGVQASHWGGFSCCGAQALGRLGCSSWVMRS